MKAPVFSTKTSFMTLVKTLSAKEKQSERDKSYPFLCWDLKYKYFAFCSCCLRLKERAQFWLRSFAKNYHLFV